LDTPTSSYAARAGCCHGADHLGQKRQNGSLSLINANGSVARHSLDEGGEAVKYLLVALHYLINWNPSTHLKNAMAGTSRLEKGYALGLAGLLRYCGRFAIFRV